MSTPISYYQSSYELGPKIAMSPDSVRKHANTGVPFRYYIIEAKPAPEGSRPKNLYRAERVERNEANKGGYMRIAMLSKSKKVPKTTLREKSDSKEPYKGYYFESRPVIGSDQGAKASKRLFRAIPSECDASKNLQQDMVTGNLDPRPDNKKPDDPKQKNAPINKDWAEVARAAIGANQPELATVALKKMAEFN